ncbi:hypothetical protein [Salinispora fenicalii]|uniref:hypothetical protein n=1 Tax=Salinispora fenicalii TaxID=1137263 RepID=UPI000488DF92|nr:hypothetical protein [Salinispora fenicalii]
MAAAGLPDGTLHVFTVVPGSSGWHRSRDASETWQNDSTQVDPNRRIFSTYTVGLPDNSIHLGTNATIS